MKTLGLTGGIGSGKTAAAKMFEDLGATRVSADDEARRLMNDDQELRADLVRAFGPEVYQPDGSLNRAALAQRVFGDAEAVKRLNAIVHPRVKSAFPKMRRRAEDAGAPLFVYEAALLVEAGLDDRFDAVAVVDAPRDIRIQRVMERDGVAREAVEARMRHQLPPELLRQRADFVIDNAGGREELRIQVAELFRTLTR